MDTRLNISDDPRLTAYALGELKGAEREEIERLLQASPEARAELEAIRQVAGALTYELAGLPIGRINGARATASGRNGYPMAQGIAQLATSRAGKTTSAEGGPQVRRRLTTAALVATAAGIAVILTIASRGGLGGPEQHVIQNNSAPTQPAEDVPQVSPEAKRQRAAEAQQLAALVEQFNTLMDERSFDEADALVKQAQQLAPDEPVIRQMIWVAHFNKNLTGGDSSPAPKAGAVANPTGAQPSSVLLDDPAQATAGQQVSATVNEPQPIPQGAGVAAGFPAVPYPVTPSPYGSQPAAGYGPAPYAPPVGDFAAAAQPSGSVAASPAVDPYSYYPQTTNRATAGSPIVGGVAAPSCTQPQSALPTATASSCCAPCAVGGAPAAASANASTARGGKNTYFNIPYTICKPVYGSTTPAATQSSTLARNAGAPAAGDSRLEWNDGWWFLDFSDNRRHSCGRGDNTRTGNESYAPIVENAFLSPLKDPLSTFSVDVDTASYANVRRFLEQGQLPPPDAVRIEEMLNYFSYDYAPPTDGKPFAVHVEAAACPWNTKHRLARIAIKGKEIPRDKRPPSNLVFLVDVSGSMDEPNKLPLVKASLAMLVESLTENDRIAIVTYAGSVQKVLDSTSGDKRREIMAAISKLSPGGSTNGEGGIQMAYETAAANFRQGGTNRIILCTDGDFNVGVSDDNELVKLIEEKRKTGVFLSIFGFGMGNLKDAKLEKLADHGNGQYGYIDSRQEARKVFVEGLSGTLVTIAKDVKLQIEFNPAQVGAYRLIGYENRALAAEDFNNDAKDAGDIGAGHSVTALYEIVPAGELKVSVDPLKYQAAPAKAADKTASDELFTLKLRYKQPDGETSQKIEIPCKDRPDASAHPSRDFDWAAGVAAFGLLLRDSKHKGNATFDLALELAQGGKGADKHGYRAECIELMRKAKGLKVPPQR